MLIIYDKKPDGPNGTTLGTLAPSPEFLASVGGSEINKYLHVAHKRLPPGTKFEIIEDGELNLDPNFRDAWEYVSGPNELIAGVE